MRQLALVTSGIALPSISAIRLKLGNVTAHSHPIAVYKQPQHRIDIALLDPDALTVTKKLREAGFLAYIVGGGVRDLLLGTVPKDFDVSTSARPEEIKRLFGRSCLLIGRRFRLAHVRFGHKVIEVATFRGGENEDDLIVQDNKWGSAEEDVLRRDFTINGLFYDAEEHTVIDYVGGWGDVQLKLLRTIGDPYVRFRQDPVRMIRLLKFQARLGFSIDPQCRQALLRCRDEIVKSSPSRVLEEVLRMLESGASSAFLRLMVEEGLMELLIPTLDHFLKGEHSSKVFQLFAQIDTYHLKGGRKRLLDRSVLMSALLYPILEEEVKVQWIAEGRIPHIGDIILLTNALVNGVILSSFFSHFPKRMSAMMSFVLSTQYRITPISGRRHHRPKLFQNKEFALALELFDMRAKVDSALVEEYRTWHQLYRQWEKQGERRHHHNQPQHPPRGTN